MKLYPVAIVCLVVGGILLYFGLQAGESFASDVKRTFTGEPTNRAMWLTIGGAVLIALGLGGVVTQGRKTIA